MLCFVFSFYAKIYKAKANILLGKVFKIFILCITFFKNLRIILQSAYF